MYSFDPLLSQFRSVFSGPEDIFFSRRKESVADLQEQCKRDSGLFLFRCFLTRNIETNITLFTRYKEFKYVGGSKVSLARSFLHHKVQRFLGEGCEGRSHRENLLSKCENATFHMDFYTILQVCRIRISAWHAEGAANRPFRQLKSETGESGLFW